MRTDFYIILIIKSSFFICSWLLSTNINVTLSTWAMERPANGPTLGKNSFSFLETCILEIKLHLFFFVVLLHVFLCVSFFGMYVAWTCHCFSVVFSMFVKIMCNALINKYCWLFWCGYTCTLDFSSIFYPLVRFNSYDLCNCLTTDISWKLW